MGVGQEGDGSGRLLGCQGRSLPQREEAGGKRGRSGAGEVEGDRGHQGLGRACCKTYTGRCAQSGGHRDSEESRQEAVAVIQEAADEMGLGCEVLPNSFFKFFF